MFKNFDKVFKFSFHNITSVASFRVTTVIIAAAILVIPSAIMLLLFLKSDGDSKGCGANTIYVVNEVASSNTKQDYSVFKEIGEGDYKKIDYIAADSIDEALGLANSEIAGITEEAAKSKDNWPKTLVVRFMEEDNTILTDIIIPANSGVSKKEAENFFDFMDDHTEEFKLALIDISEEAYKKINVKSMFKTYTETGYKNGITIDEDEEGGVKKSSEGILDGLKMAFPYITAMFMYFMIIIYGSDISRTMVMEKESKLMDTMLVSLHPEALVFGKLLAGVAAGFMQLGIWMVSIVVGVFIGSRITGLLGYAEENPISIFLRHASELGAFSAVGIILGVLILTIGFILYSTLAAIAGALAANEEELSSQTVIFVLPLAFSLMAYIYAGGLSGDMPAWLYFIPFTATLVAPGAAALGMMPMWQTIVCIVIMIALTMGLIIFAGRLYKMTSLYKGNALKLGAAIKMMSGK